MHPTLIRLCTAIPLLGLLIACTYAPIWMVSVGILLILLAILLTEWARLITTPWLWFLTPIYPALPFLLALHLNQDPHYRHLLLVLIACVGANDTGAYCFGKLWGKNKLCPTISPGKTWQGFGGGFLAVIGMLCLINLYTNDPQAQSNMSWPVTLVIAALVACVATAGDLFESWLKRRAGVKDSGSLLPGHGGLLDRFDGMMSCMYLLYPLKDLLLRWF